MKSRAFLAGIDTVGGVRVPSAFCGILGFRPSYGAVSHMGIIPISTSLDTVGNWRIFVHFHLLDIQLRSSY